MGLDMFIYKFNKIDNEEYQNIKTMPIDERTKYCSDRYRVLFDSDIGDHIQMYSDILPYCRKVKLNRELFDYDKCLIDHGVEPDDKRTGASYSASGIHMVFQSEREINMDMAEYRSYVYTKEELAYIFDNHEVLYWRKEYDLCDFIEHTIYQTKAAKLRKHIDDPNRSLTEEEWKMCSVENCGYYKLTASDRKQIKKYLQEEPDVYTQTELGGAATEYLDILDESDLVYLEWY